MDQAAGTKNQKLLYQNFSLAFIDTHTNPHTLVAFMAHHFLFFILPLAIIFFSLGQS